MIAHNPLNGEGRAAFPHPANASTPLLRAAPHDSGPMWVASSISYYFCIHYTSPV